MSTLHPIHKRADVPSARLARIYDYWLRLKGDRIGPPRSVIEPTSLRGDLPWVWLVDVFDGGEDFGFRLAGGQLKQFMGHNYAGKRISEVPQSTFFKNVGTVFSTCVASRQPLLVGPARTTLKDKSHLEITVLVLPMSENNKDVSMLFGGFESAHIDLPPGVDIGPTRRPR
jgi:hypothetical protein